MARYIVIYRVDGIRYSDSVRATSPEDAEQKMRLRYPSRKKFEVVSTRILTPTKRTSGQYYKPFVSLPTFKQFTCSFTVMNMGVAEVKQIALHALDEASARETLQHTYPTIIVNTIRIVEAN